LFSIVEKAFLSMLLLCCFAPPAAREARFIQPLSHGRMKTV